MTDTASRCVAAEGMREALVAYLCEEGCPEENARIEAHVAECDACAEELDSMRAVRRALGAWTVPDPDSSIRVVAGNRPARLRWRRLYEARWELATAAGLLLAAAVAIGGIELHSGPEGFVVRVGWARDSGSDVLSAEASVGDPGGAVHPAAGSNGLSTRGADRGRESFPEQFGSRQLTGVRAGGTELGSRFGPLPDGAGGATSVSGVFDPGAGWDEAEVMRRLSDLIAQSERRQKQELALWFTEFAQEFDMQRLADQQRMQEELGALEGYADYLVWVTDGK